LAALSLVVLVAATRLPLLGRGLGEADAARYLVGLLQWQRAGRAAPFIYAKVLSPGYYALAAALTEGTAGNPQGRLALVSLLAALAAAPVALAVGLRLASRPAAIAGTALFLLSPAMWWLGIEPHPQGMSFLLLLLAILSFVSVRGLTGKLLAAGLLGLGMLVKSDLILFAGVFPALRARLEEGSGWRRCANSLWVPGAALALFFAGRHMLLGMSWATAQGQTDHALRQFLALPHGAAWLKQLLPMALAPGLATAALTAWGLGWGTGVKAWRRRWLPLIAVWAAPGTVFWLLLRGNNARHMAPFLLVPLWASLEAMENRWAAKTHWRQLGDAASGTRIPCRPSKPSPRTAHKLAAAWGGSGSDPGARWPRHLAWVCVAVAGLNLILVPPSSNLTLYPSGNVPASARDLAARLVEARAQLSAATADRSALPCFVGDYSLPYLEWTLLQASPGATLRATPTGAELAAGSHAEAQFIEIASGSEYSRAARWCQQMPAEARSLEYTPNGGRRWFLGRELGRLPWVRRDYTALSHELRH